MKLVRALIRAADSVMHRTPFRVRLVCDLYDWSLGMSWKDARS